MSGLWYTLSIRPIGETDMPKNSGSLGLPSNGSVFERKTQNAKAERTRKWVVYVATIVQHLCDTKGVGHTVAVAIAESYTYTKAKQFAQRIKRGEA